MTEFEKIVVGRNSIPSLIVSAVLMILIPVGFFLYWRLKHKEQTTVAWLFVGVAAFMVSARVLELGVHYLCILMDHPVSRFINGNTAAFVLYGVIMAGVFEECGRHIVLKYILKRNRTPENAVLYGIGHGGIEVLTVVLPMMITYLAISVLFSAGDTAKALSALNITEETAAAALPSVQAAASFGYGMMALNVLERLLAMFAHIGLTVIVYYGVVRTKKGYLQMAILLHMLMDTFAALYQKGVVPLWTVEVWGALWTAVIVIFAAKLFRKMKVSSSGEGEPVAGCENRI
ncbi:MAG: YhfC family intramembrane metalloprotease [Oscillospiraceae bacterium]|nr:YhfC family intramembrane metalloprotease [Oscillospiraceae bacterium]